MNKKIIISSLNVLNDRFYNFKLNAFEMIAFDKILFEIKIKLNKSLISFLTKIVYFLTFFLKL